MIKLHALGAAMARKMIKAGQYNQGDAWPDTPDTTGLADHHYLGIDAEGGVHFPFAQNVLGSALVFHAALQAIELEALSMENEVDTEVATTAADLTAELEAAAAAEHEPDTTDLAGEEEEGGKEPPPDIGKIADIQALVLKGVEEDTGVDVYTMPATRMYRTVEINLEKVDREARTVELSLSSEEPYERYFGIEVLGHQAGEIVTDYLDAGMSALFNHWLDDLIGVWEEYWIKDGKLGGRIKFARHQDAEDKFQMVLDGILHQASVGYDVLAWELLDGGDTGKGIPPTWRAIKWLPMEGSLVTVAADIQVGVGRSARERATHEALVLTRARPGWTPPATLRKREAAEPTAPPVVPETANRERKDDPMPEEKTLTLEDAQARIDAAVTEREMGERTRRDAILALADSKADVLPNIHTLARQALKEDFTLEEFQGKVLDGIMEAKGATKVDPEDDQSIGMTEKELEKFSLLRAIDAKADPSNQRKQDAAGFEREVCEEAENKLHRAAKGNLVIPMDYLKAKLPVPRGQLRRRMLAMQRAQMVGSDTAGGYLVSQDHMNFIDMLENRMLLMGMSTVFTGLNGDISFTKKTGGTTAYWGAENVAPTESELTLGEVVMRPKTVSDMATITRKLLLQSGNADAEAILKDDLALRIALAGDYAGFHGENVQDPEGIFNTTGVGLVECDATNGAAPVFKDIVDMETEVSVDNADVLDMAYVTNARGRGKLKTTVKESGNPSYIWSEGNQMNGYNAFVSNQIRADFTKGGGSSLSGVVFGNFRDVYMALWGSLDILVNPYASGGSGSVRLELHQDMDIVLVRPESMCIIKDMVTT